MRMSDTIEKLVELLRKADFTDAEIFEFCVGDHTFDNFMRIYESHHGDDVG